MVSTKLVSKCFAKNNLGTWPILPYVYVNFTCVFMLILVAVRVSMGQGVHRRARAPTGVEAGVGNRGEK